MQTAISWYWPTEESHDRDAESEPMGRRLDRRGYGQAGDTSYCRGAGRDRKTSTMSSSAKEIQERFFGVRDVLEQLTQKVAIARDEGMQKRRF